MKIAFVETNLVVRELIAMELEGDLCCDVVEINTIADLKKIIEVDTVDLILSNHELADGTSDEIFYYLKEIDSSIPLIIKTDYDLEEQRFFKDFSADCLCRYLYKKNDFSSLVSCIEGLLECVRLLPRDKFVPIKLIRFLRFNETPCDLYLKLSKQKYVKLINKDDLYDDGLIEKYSWRGVAKFYVTRVSFIKFCKVYSRELIRRLKSTEQKPEILNNQLGGVAFVHEVLNKLGIPQVLIEALNATVKSVVDSIKMDKGLRSYFDILEKEQNYLYEHSLLIAYIAGSISHSMSWGTDATIEKLSLAAVLHDVTLEEIVDKCSVQAVENLSPEIETSLSRKEMRLLKDHPLAISRLITDNRSFPSDVDRLIEHHHELPGGGGFPRGSDASKLPPMSCLFILAEAFVTQIYGMKINDQLIKKTVKNLKMTYSGGNFKRPFEGLQKLFN